MEFTLVHLILLLIVIVLIYKIIESYYFCESFDVEGETHAHNNIKGVSLYNQGYFYAPKPMGCVPSMARNDFMVGVPWYNVGTNRTTAECQQLSIDLQNDVDRYNILTRDQANKEWESTSCF